MQIFRIILIDANKLGACIEGVARAVNLYGLFLNHEEGNVGIKPVFFGETMSTRLFAMEGCLHLYSSQACALYPSELYWAENNEEMRELLTGCNLYLIAKRKRIAVDAASLEVAADSLTGKFVVSRNGKWCHAPFHFKLPSSQISSFPSIVEVGSTLSGSHVSLKNEKGSFNISAHTLVANAESDLGDLRDLEVLYVGQGIGKSRPKLAVDRLVEHSKLQRILAEVMTYEPDAEIMILLFRFEHSRMFLSTGGDLTLEPKATAEQERAHFDRLGKSRFDRKGRVGLAEAALINYFQPPYNITFKETDFAAKKRMKLLRELDKIGVTGLIVEICTANIRAKLYTEAQQPSSFNDIFPAEADFEKVAAESEAMRLRVNDELAQMLHTHFVRLPLTTSEERNTFLHGMKWNDNIPP